MRRGDVGPAGAVALVVVLLLQVGALAGVLAAGGATTAVVTLVLAVAVSRGGLALVCARGIAPARADGVRGAAGCSPRVSPSAWC